MSAITKLALVYVGGASFYGDGSDVESAVSRCLREIKNASRVLGKLKPDARITFNVFDYEPYSSIYWDDLGVTGVRQSDNEREQISPIMLVVTDGKGNELERRDIDRPGPLDA